MTYDIKCNNNGEMTFTSWGVTNLFSTIISTDYKTFILQYKCKQAYMDLYTQEYIDIYTPDGTISDDLLNLLKGIVKAKMPKFNIEGLLMPSKTNNCDTVNAWGFI